MRRKKRGKDERLTTTADLQKLLKDVRLSLDCGHHCTVGHNFANTLIILSQGGGRITTVCHSCY